MPQSMIIPPEWLVEAGVQSFKPTRPGFRCDDPDHRLFALADIEPPVRFSGYPLSANGFDHDRMVRLLTGIRGGVALPHILIEAAEGGDRQYRVHQGLHRYHASRTLGFSHVPAEVIDRRY
jgi:hypothetical protein